MNTFEVDATWSTGCWEGVFSFSMNLEDEVTQRVRMRGFSAFLGREE